jgi:hypothetical protein
LFLDRVKQLDEVDGFCEIAVEARPFLEVW